MGSRIIYYSIILPIALLPYPLLYLFSNFFFFLLFGLIGYRKKVVFKNIQNSFPEKTVKEQQLIMRNFYKHFCDLIVESLKGFVISEKQLKERFSIVNAEIANQYFKAGKDVIFVGGHYNNWEILAQGVSLELKHQIIGIYKPLSNKYFDGKMKKSREKKGMLLCPIKETKAFLDKDFGKPKGTIFAIDQSPGNPGKSYWMQFLNQDTPVLFGAEKYAKEYKSPVIFCTINKVKRGYYQGVLSLIEATPEETLYGEITESNTKALEKDIIENPQFWLWTHRRWKHKRKVAD
ncbi:MAG: lysophospholipid acyltransferase family protein [Flavobacteriales bacterium]|nr:lysophospholipid acyltransferase family protein [Flavobacteriales bacterium]